MLYGKFTDTINSESSKSETQYFDSLISAGKRFTVFVFMVSIRLLQIPMKLICNKVNQ